MLVFCIGFLNKSIPNEWNMLNGTATLGKDIHKTACRSGPLVLLLLKEIIIPQENHEKSRFSYGCVILR